MSGLRRRFFDDWTEEREDHPQGIRDLVGVDVPLQGDPDEKHAAMRSGLPGDSVEELRIANDANLCKYVPNPYSCMMPSRLREFLRDESLSVQEKKLVKQAYANLS